MTKREAKTINPCLKAKAYIKKDDGAVLVTGTITQVKDLPATKHGDKIVITVNATMEKNDIKALEIENISDEQIEKGMIDVFVNNYTLSVLCADYGDNDEKWIGKSVKITKETDKNFNSVMLVVRANEETVKPE